jgi:hypothetical protein
VLVRHDFDRHDLVLLFGFFVRLLLLEFFFKFQFVLFDELLSLVFKELFGQLFFFKLLFALLLREGFLHLRPHASNKNDQVWPHQVRNGEEDHAPACKKLGINIWVIVSEGDQME